MIELFVQNMKDGDNVALASLFSERGVMHDTSVLRAGMDVIHLEGRMAIEMMFHHKFGFNGGPFPISGIRYFDERIVWYFITYNGKVVPVMATLSEMEDGKIKRLNIYPL